MNDDSTRFDLDDRQCAMLAEMGVRVWTPLAAALPAQGAASSAPAVSAAAAMHAPASAVPVAAPPSVRPLVPDKPTPAPAASIAATPTETVESPLPQGLDEMDWPALQNAAATCQACGLCGQRQHSVFGMGSMQADWLVLGDAPGDAENASGQPFAGDAGRLLDNMLKAVGLSRDGQGQAGAYLMHATQCPTPDARNPSPEELRRCAAYVARKVALVQPRVILVMGRFAMQSLLQSTEPLGKMRGQVHQHLGIPVVVTYPPAYLLRNPADKGKAWVDLCLALKVVQDSR